jgi:glycosyltransferase involved in cell wall biosynthesis
MMRRPCIAIVSPFLDKRHGTERCVAEQAERLARDHSFDVHLFTQHIADLPGARPFAGKSDEVAGPTDGNPAAVSGGLFWHRVPDVPGPQLVKYLWWFAANHVCRWLSRQRGVQYDLLYSPGINCLDAGLISVHIVFAEFVRQVRQDLAFRRHPLRFWPRLAHRRLYYRLLILLESWVYSGSGQQLVVVSKKVADDVRQFYGRKEDLPVVYHGLDLERFHPQRRDALRGTSRVELGLRPDDFVVLLVGNDFLKKGLRYVLEAVARVGDERVKVVVVGEDDPSPYRDRIRLLGLEGRVQFQPVRPDVDTYYAAADVYAGPSLEDAFALPPAEAMACGVPAIVSRRAGVSEIITDGVDGFVLGDPADAPALAEHMKRLLRDTELRKSVGQAAARTARKYTWDQNVAEMKRWILDTIAARHPARSVEQFS